MSERRGNPRDQDPTQLALEAASRALAAANAAVEAAYKAVALSRSRRYEDDERLDRRAGSIRRAASQARRSAGGEASGDVPLAHPPAKARTRKHIAVQAAPGTPTPFAAAVEEDAVGAEPIVESPGEEVPVESPAIDVPAEEVPVESPAIDVPAEVVPVESPAIDVPPEEVPVESTAIDVPAIPGSAGRSAFAARKHGVDEATEAWPGIPENGVSHETRVRPAPETTPEPTEPGEQSIVEDQAIPRPDGAGPIHLGPSTAVPAVEAAAFPPPFVEDVIVTPPVIEAPAASHLDEVEVALHEAELHARELEMEAREAAMALYAPMEPPRRVPARPQAELNGYTVLVVDDEEQVRALTVRILSRYGYHVLEASGVEIALRLLDEPTADVDLVLSDVAMPGLSGKDLFRAISESRPGLPVVFMSGYALGVYAPEGLVEEGVKMLPKPFTQEDLLEFVTGALEGAAAR